MPDDSVSREHARVTAKKPGADRVRTSSSAGVREAVARLDAFEGLPSRVP